MTISTIRRTFVVLLAALALTSGLVAVTAASADAAPAVSKKATKPNLVKLRGPVKFRVVSRAGAVLYSTRTGKVVRDKRDRARRLPSGQVKTYTHRSRFKGREYRRIAGKTYMVRLASLRVVPKPRPAAKPKPRPVVKPVPKPTPTTPAPTPTPTPTPAPEPEWPASDKPVLVVQGDSITAEFNDIVGDAKQGWWSMLAADKGATVRTDAVSGSGFDRRGRGCMEPSFRERLSRIAKMGADTLMIVGGRNEPLGCPRGVRTEEQIRAGIEAYFRELSVIVHQANIRRVYVATVWGTSDQAGKEVVAKYARQYAESAGYPYLLIDLDETQVYDAIHPNLAGSTHIFESLRAVVEVDRPFAPAA